MDRSIQKFWVATWVGAGTTVVRAPDRLTAARILAKVYPDATEAELQKKVEEVPADGPDEILFEFW